MYNLRDIKETVQQTAEAIAEALLIEVEIADRELVRVAGTGRYKEGRGRVLKDGFVYGHILRTGQPVIIDKPGHHELCQPCLSRGNCSEKAEVAVPIRIEGDTVGVIGLIGFEVEQAKRLLGRKDSLLRFLEKMADLIAVKTQENLQKEQRETLVRQLETMLNVLNDGLMVVNAEKTVIHYNQLAAQMTDMVAEQEVSLSQIMDEKKLWKSIEKGKPFSGQVKGRRAPSQWYCDAVPIHGDGGEETVEGAIIILKDVQEIKRLVKDTTVSDIATEFSQIIGESNKIKELKELSCKVAAGNSTLLIQGESGTGKELLARAIHQSSTRSQHSFIAINCGAIPETLLESELFGYEEGSFTGAKRGGKLGKFELAHNGTIFLDEIGDMPLHLQVKILRVLQERRVEKVGSSRSTPVDVRVIAATHRNLEKMVASGEFREDLYYRLSVIPLNIPPLRERPEDIPLLIEHYLEHYCTVLGKNVTRLTPDAALLLSKYSWPGNVRELSNVIEYAVTMAIGGSITVKDLPKRIKTEEPVKAQESCLHLKTLEREAIAKALQVATSEGSKDNAAHLLGISRATLYRKIKEYNIAEHKLFS
ncbi:sigma 54-interacting transcriptional regulator [Heliobacterium chlorum]|uniref:Sigma 54-interacting transcriptional regulator n=1 Tax=Heliobacterium chlorum TaxID=2698 RepID=A0ABR7T542_HELCL|nr:sigma 54-interacting transcriptional regulator [Heliobacterium chlorum]MBC9785123.1 sigma 54-interacting transcriptional regulator [Heliobacterium chlorum]